MTQAFNYTRISAICRPQAALILLHGLGANAEDLREVVDALELPAKDATEFILPHATLRPVTIADGMNLSAWFDIYDRHRNSPEDTVGINQSVRKLACVIDETRQRGISAQRIFIGGFSQGGALALRYAYCSAIPLGGVIGLSCYLPLRHTRPALADTDTGRNNPPVFLSHGVADDVIPLDFAETARDILRRHHFDVTWRTYPVGHHLYAQVISDLSRWLAKRYKVLDTSLTNTV